LIAFIKKKKIILSIFHLCT
ncbi:hypothetical protein A5887_002645, partial [Enterococcus faecium]